MIEPTEEILSNGTFFTKGAEDLEKYLIQFRRELHRHPELAYHEVYTSKRVCEELEKNDISYERIKLNMVIATIKGAHTGKTIGIRADMDALPMEEKNDVDYRSKVEGVMHSCGHDGHTAMLVGAGILLNGMKENLKGTIKLIFQSAEEVGGGVTEIIEHLEKSGGLDRLLGLHVWADIESGYISIEPGGRMAGGIFFDIEVKGQGGHGSRPDKAKDPIKPACEILLQAAALPSSRFNILEPCVISPALIQGGTAFNIIPDTARVGGTIRYFSYDAGQKLSDLVASVAENTAKAYGVEAIVSFSGHVSPIVNTEDAASLGKKSAAKIRGLSLTAFEPICACDCFGDLLKKYPGVYCYMGIHNKEKGIVYPQHHCQFDLDESVLKKGCAFLSQYAYDFLSE